MSRHNSDWPEIAMLTIFLGVPIGIGSVFLLIGGIGLTLSFLGFNEGWFLRLIFGPLLILIGSAGLGLFVGYVTGKWQWSDFRG